MRLTIAAIFFITLGGCISTITRQEFETMRATASPTFNSMPGPGNNLRYMGTKDGYDYYYLYRRTSTLDTESTYRVPTDGAADTFPYTTNHTQWRPVYGSEQALAAMKTP